MAEEKKEENKEETSETAPAKEGGNKLLMIVIIVLLLLLLVIGGLVAYFLLSSDNNTSDPSQNPADNGKSKQVEQKKPKKNSADLTIGPIYPMDPFIVNLMSDGARRFLKCTLNLEMDSPDLQPELDKKVPLLRDLIIRILSSKTVAEISTSKGKEKLKAEIVRNINEKLESGEIKHVYLVNFVIQ